jgi:hypothetical protein
MLLKEMFSPVGAPKDEQPDIDWIGDLKFYMDNNDDMLNKHFFPAVQRHKEYRGNPNAYKIYIRSLEGCLESYCEKYEIEDRDEKFPKEKLEELAKQIATQQEKFMEKGDYDK